MTLKFIDLFQTEQEAAAAAVLWLRVSLLSLMSKTCLNEFPLSDAELDLDLSSADPTFVSSPPQAADVPGCSLSLVAEQGDNRFIMRKKSRECGPSDK